MVFPVIMVANVLYFMNSAKFAIPVKNAIPVARRRFFSNFANGLGASIVLAELTLIELVRGKDTLLMFGNSEHGIFWWHALPMDGATNAFVTVIAKHDANKRFWPTRSLSALMFIFLLLD
jgi:hypothetical protein